MARTLRAVEVDGRTPFDVGIDLDLAKDLHIIGYHEMLNGRGTPVSEAIPALKLAEAIKEKAAAQ